MLGRFENLTLDSIEIPVSKLAGILSKVWKEGKFPLLLLSGKMGSGKTTFVSKLVKALLDQLKPGLDKSKLFVNSPTYTLMNEYPFPEILNQTGDILEIFHFDLYRIGSSEEIPDLGFEEYWNGKGISLIEWWEKAEPEFKDRKFCIKIDLEEADVDTRNLKVEFLGEEWRRSDLQIGSFLKSEKTL
ncbi:tRNA (adenosine(37)-N6)-threonylcarbamoyltransferase complex ATPase subunit type 1 TsaE [Leptospira andrefontaineae]|uniref:tRNA threonylcarbamoyladenosine biosynthesis protein TsaE n=1 Tax=Leptospira andrefontaineae TaxID=2484976 RepID=A0A4R9H146_9LEPT|nr:tRNA (adenosine(37)-N6)-threonylcarbamoyltransferase complex ATPase subunit type 1 TsaE [Leptospira andrefontaineae]TGK38059.1 tRNA (adenosine(37)-N6)-threonylcarbamoyltransferase complex ATPase subunit type 1 TsaE [Leptospira andrefontaineae]